MRPLILALDRGGLPQRWIDPEIAVTYHAKGLVAWSLGAIVCIYRGGIQRSGLCSRIDTQAIIAIRGLSSAHRYRTIPALTNALLFARDRYVCAYCGGRYTAGHLSLDHVTPASHGGARSWNNAVTACRPCNTRKADRTPQQAGMQLLYVPYTPNRNEHFILRNRAGIRADQMEFLIAGVPPTSRLHLS